MCGFSGRAIQILKACGVEPKAIATVNVLEDQKSPGHQGLQQLAHHPPAV
jgi:monothiol glutaredoxin